MSIQRAHYTCWNIKSTQENKQNLAGHQVFVRSFCDLMFFLCLSRMLRCLTACYLAALQKPRSGTTTVHWGRASALDSILTANTQQPPYKPTGGESSTAEQPVHWESVGRTGPLDSVPLSDFLCMCLSHFIFSLWIQTQTGTWCWQQVADPSRVSAVYLSAVTTVISVAFSHLRYFRNSVACIST